MAIWECLCYMDGRAAVYDFSREEGREGFARCA